MLPAKQNPTAKCLSDDVVNFIRWCYDPVRLAEKMDAALARGDNYSAGKARGQVELVLALEEQLAAVKRAGG